MNIVDVLKKENLGKTYNVYLNEKYLGEWEVRTLETRKSNIVELCNEDGEWISYEYFVSEMVEMDFREIKK